MTPLGKTRVTLKNLTGLLDTNLASPIIFILSYVF